MVSLFVMLNSLCFMPYDTDLLLTRYSLPVFFPFGLVCTWYNMPLPSYVFTFCFLYPLFTRSNDWRHDSYRIAQADGSWRCSLYIARCRLTDFQQNSGKGTRGRDLSDLILERGSAVLDFSTGKKTTSTVTNSVSSLLRYRMSTLAAECKHVWSLNMKGGALIRGLNKAVLHY